MLTHRQTDIKWTNKQTEFHQFLKQLSYDGNLSTCQVLIRLYKAFLNYSPETEMLMDTGIQNGQTNGWNYTNFKSNLAMMVLYLPVRFEFDWTKCFQVRVQKQKC